MADITVDSLPKMLSSSGVEREEAYSMLRDLLVRVALAYLVRQRYPLHAFGADSYDTLAEDFAQQALEIIMRQLNSFRAESRFTTWAYQIIINLMADEYRRRAWRRRSLEEGVLERPATLWQVGPDASVERRKMWALLETLILQELTPRQRQALIGRVFQGKPLVVLAEELGTDKDNVYKLIHDARKHLKRELQARGIMLEEWLESFE